MGALLPTRSEIKIIILYLELVKVKNMEEQDLQTQNSVSWDKKVIFGLPVIVWGIVVISLTIFVGGTYILGTHFEKLPQSIQQQIGSLYENKDNLASSSELAGWKTYRNEEYGFEFMHPSDWIFKQSKNKGFDLFSKQNYQEQGTPQGHESIPELSMDIIQNPSNLSFSQWYKENEEESALIVLGVGIEDAKTIKLANGIIAYDVREPGTGDCCERVYIPIKNFFISFRALCFYRLDCQDRIETKILSTFKFIEPATDISTWKTYRNEEYGFEFKYLADEFSSKNFYFFPIEYGHRSGSLGDYSISRKIASDIRVQKSCNPFFSEGLILDDIFLIFPMNHCKVFVLPEATTISGVGIVNTYEGLPSMTYGVLIFLDNKVVDIRLVPRNDFYTSEIEKIRSEKYPKAKWVSKDFEKLYNEVKIYLENEIKNNTPQFTHMTETIDAIASSIKIMP